MKLGIVGLPNVGKSTLFNAITKAGAEAANYPFCTIEPNVGIVTVPDERVTTLSDIYHSKKTIYATMSPPPSSTSCAALTTRTSCTSTAKSIPCPTSRRSTSS